MLHDGQINIYQPNEKEDYKRYYNQFRSDTEALAQPLEKEDYMMQAMTDASPTKWHLAHVSWFFEAFLLKKFRSSYKPQNELYDYLFNSYYLDHSQPFMRPQRGQISRPTVDEVYEFRRFIDQEMISLLDGSNIEDQLKSLILLGGNHEQQHQELILTDLKYNFSINPMFPVYKRSAVVKTMDESLLQIEFKKFNSGVIELGYSGDGFAFDNELPIHKNYIQDFKMANRLVTNGEYLRFIEAGGYHDHRYWLSEGWDQIRQHGWEAPLHWHKIEGEWYNYTLGGLKKLDENEPVVHVSYFEADAFAKWSGKRLPTETEWEHVASKLDLNPNQGNFVNSGLLHPSAISPVKLAEQSIAQMFGDVWEWTQSAYLPYPGFSVLAEGISEYNGKFMSSQFVLKGGSCVTPPGHMRKSYRNFWHPQHRFQFTGIRLAE